MWYSSFRVTQQALPFYFMPNSSPARNGSTWPHPSLCKKTWLSHWGACCSFGCACNPQTPPASLYQHSSTTKTTPTPKHVPSSKPASSPVDATADAEQAACNQTLGPVWFLSFLWDSMEEISSPLSELQCITDMGVASLLLCWYSGDSSRCGMAINRRTTSTFCYE